MKTRRSLALILLLGVAAAGLAGCAPALGPGYGVDAEGPYLERTLSPFCVTVLGRGMPPPEPETEWDRRMAASTSPTKASDKFMSGYRSPMERYAARDDVQEWRMCQSDADSIRRVPRVHLPAGYQPADQGPVGMRCIEFPRGFTNCSFQ